MNSTFLKIFQTRSRFLAFDDPKARGSSLSLDEATPLATVLVDRIAKLEGIRALILKGPLASIEKLRPPRPSYDVDVLTAPHHAQRLVDALVCRGWQVRSSPGFPKLLPDHSRSLSHRDWPVDVDVHWNWPGFLIDDELAFESLWRRKRKADLAGVQIEAPSRADSALILALHVLREEKNLTRNGRRTAEYRHLVTSVLNEPETMASIRASAAELQAEHTARRFLEDLGYTDLPTQTADEQRFAEWRMHQQANHPVSAWLHELDQTPWWKRPLTVWRGIFPSASALRAIDPFIGDGPMEILRGWWRRVRRGFRTAPIARKNLNEAKRDRA